MARKPAKVALDAADPGMAERGYWQEEIAKASKRFEKFHEQGKLVQERYRLHDRNGSPRFLDRYNILYSSTETIKPSLYTRTPQVEAVQRSKDRNTFKVTMGTLLMEAVTQYALEEMDFDTPVKSAIQDYLLPGMGQVWARYEPDIKQYTNDNGESYEKVAGEGVTVDYVHWRDWLCGAGRIWPEVPWVARRVYFNKKKATKRFGADIANKLSYSYTQSSDSNDRKRTEQGGDQAQIWEIWNKEDYTVLWFSPDYAEGLLDKKDDPLHLKDFFPCPQPLRAVHTTETIVPGSFYEQYRAQAEEIDELTARIRHLTKAIRVIGVYDATQKALERLLNGNDNRMVPVENWAAFAQGGGVDGAVQWVPIKEIALVLSELYKQREIAKAEVYEITGFSDIVRGVSKASETLGAQQIKNEWAGGRLRNLQTEVQNFTRDILRIVAEIIIEQFSEDNLAAYAGFEPPEVTPEEQQAVMQYAQGALMGQVPPGPPPETARTTAIRTFLDVVKFLKDEKQRCAKIGIETDSTIQPDESQERKDRLEFLGQIGAFLQQAGPMALQYPDMRGLLGSLMMFAVHTFRQSRSVEKEFEEFTKKLESQPPMPQDGKGGEAGDNGQAAADASLKVAEIKAQADTQKSQNELTLRQTEIQGKLQLEAQRIKQDHEYNMAQVALKNRELDIREREVDIKEAEIGVKQAQVQQQAAVDAAEQVRADRDQDHRETVDMDAAEREDRQFDQQQAADEAARKDQAAGSKESD